ncbi:alpha-amylase family glycosyl hydrolase [Evansella halocellulosilytica]|uniref:alpha-amylase family glycosyl hydrolase n=1 Tax=Evansella halocellulosilytica TaxID=2011013 RepID=UPI000BB948E7|nr:alpha-amylase family glycosyl hydrolase [Evansella halocellulosilytica]
MFRKLMLAIVMTVGVSSLFLMKDEHVVSSDSSTDLESVNYAQEVIYQIVTDRFHDGDPSNNPEGELYSPGCEDLTKYCGGDWQGIIDKIESGYLPEMGITTIWISPPVENVTGLHPEGFASYHGYWARDFKRTNPFFGDFEDFSQLIQTAHDYDIKVVIDFVPNHTSPVDIEDGVLYDDGNFVGEYSNDDQGYFYHYGGSDFSSYEDGIYRNLYDLASLNQQHPFIDDYLKESIEMWLDMGVDGLRIDAVAHMPFGWQKTFVDTIYDHQPVFTFGEWFTSAEGSEEYHHFVNNSGMSALDFRYAQVVQDVLRNHNGTMHDIEHMLSNTENAYDRPQDQVTFIDNHDIDRFTVDGQSTRTTDLALAFLLTSRGVPTIYYGTEHYMTGEGDPGNREMMDSSFDRSTTAYQVIQTLSSMRQENTAIAYGNTTERWVNDDVFIYERSFNGEYALVALNRNVNQSYNIEQLITDMPAQSYEDVLGGLLDGQSITVNENGSVAPFTLSPGEVSVWQFTNDDNLSPEIGQVGPPMGKPGDDIKISGTGFGDTQGRVHLGDEELDVIYWNDESITVSLPNIEGGKQDLTVTRATGEGSNGYEFELLSGSQVSVRFVVNNAETSLGENVYLVGNVPELGNWDPDQSIGPMFNQVVYSYPTWYYDVSVPAGEELEFKFLIIDSNGNVTWESGDNHMYTTPENSTGTISVDFRR